MKETKLPCDKCIVELACKTACKEILKVRKIYTTNYRVYLRLLRPCIQMNTIKYKNLQFKRFIMY